MFLGSGSMPIIVLSQNTKRESGPKVQLGNVAAAKAIADVIRTCLGPCAMLKMLMDPNGGVVMTNDGNAILREIQVQHPAAKSMLEISRTQDEETGDGTTSVIVLAGEVLSAAEPFLQQKMHPTIIIKAFRMAIDDIVKICKDQLSVTIDPENRNDMYKIVKSCLGTKMIGKWMDLAVDIAVEAVRIVAAEQHGRKEIDIKRFVRLEMLPGGRAEDSYLLKGVMLNKDVTHANMRRYIENPRIVLLDSPLEYKKGESQTQFEITKDENFTRMLKVEEHEVERMCSAIIAVKADIVFTEKGISDLAQHHLMKANVTAVRRLKRTDMDRLARVCGAKIVSEPLEIRESDVGTLATLFQTEKIGDEYFSFVYNLKNPKACTIVMRGASKDVLQEMQRNFNDALNVVRNVMLEPKVLPGGGATEMSLAQILTEKSKSIEGVRQWPYRAIAQALEVIPRTLIQNCGSSAIRQLTALRAKHAEPGNETWGIDGDTGNLADMRELNIWDPLSVKVQVYKTAVESAILLLRIDDIVSGMKKKDDSGKGPQPVAARDGADSQE